MTPANLDSTSATPRLRRLLSRIGEPQVLFPAVAVVILGVIWGATLNVIEVETGLASRAAAASTMEIADTYEAQVVRNLREIDQTLKVIKFAHERGGGTVDLKDLGTKGLLPPGLLFVVSVADATGSITASTRPLAKTSIADDRFFHDLETSSPVAVSRPMLDPGASEPKLLFARRLERPDGSFAGAAIVSVPATYFVSGYETAKLGRQGVLGLLGVDGVFRARRTGEGFAAGDKADYASIVRAADEAVAIRSSPWDGVRRYTVAREAFDFPLGLIVGISEEEQLAAVRERAEGYVWKSAGASIIVILVLGALGGLGWQLARIRLRANRALQDEIAIRRSAESALKLRDRAIESSVNAILIADMSRPEHPIEYVNPAFERITGYSAAEAIGRGTGFLLGGERERAGAHEIESALRERREGHAVLRSYRKDGTLFWNDFYVAPVRNDAGEVTHFVGVMNDVTEAKQYEAQLTHQANYDSLTGLANRNLLQDRLQQAIVNARRNRNAVATVFLDIDNFKLVNDTLGHRVGDELLRQVAARLAACVRESDTVARLGGDEFVLVLNAGGESGARSLEADVSAIMNKLLGNVSTPLRLENRQIRPTCSIGVSIFPQDGDSADTLLRNADAAMYRAKELGRNRFQLFTADVHERIRHRMELESSLRLALERNEFVLHYQPQVELRTGSIVGVEALLRWKHPEKGLVGPTSFIRFAEESGLIMQIGSWVLRTACAQNKAWQDAGLPRLPVAVNMSARQCEEENIELIVREALQSSGLDPQYLELEITESISMANPTESVPLMRRLKQIGVSLSIDDFGTGFSNLSYLPRFPIDRLKIDLSFVREMVRDSGSLAISEAIITMSHSLALEVVAEGVETDRQLELLGARHCDSIQGYLFSPPLEADDMAQMLREGRRLDYRAPPRHHMPANVDARGTMQ